MPIITLSVEDVTRARIQAIAKARRQTLSAVVDTAVELLASQDQFESLNAATVKSGISNPSDISGVRKGTAA